MSVCFLSNTMTENKVHFVAFHWISFHVISHQSVNHITWYSSMLCHFSSYNMTYHTVSDHIASHMCHYISWNHVILYYTMLRHCFLLYNFNSHNTTDSSSHRFTVPSYNDTLHSITSQVMTFIYLCINLFMFCWLF